MVKTNKQKAKPFAVTEPPSDERAFRIVTAALEVFSEFSFRDATTDEIARRASVSKRDIYAAFSNKHALLIAVINMVLETGDENLTNVVSLTNESTSLHERLEVVGLALINEILSPASGFLSRIVSSESISQPHIGAAYLENWYDRRTELVSQVLSMHAGRSSRSSRQSPNTTQPAKHYLALITHLPQLTAFVGIRDIWHSRSVQTHVRSGVECFLTAYPGFE